MNEIVQYWDKAVCEAWHGDAPVGSALWSEQVTRHRYYVQPHILEFAEFRRWEGKSVLEIGCGIGTDTKKFMNAGAKVWAVDSSEKSIEIADLRCPKAMFYCQDAEAWLPYGPFDLIWSFGVLHHTPHPEKVLKLAAARTEAGWGTEDHVVRQMVAQASSRHTAGSLGGMSPGKVVFRARGETPRRVLRIRSREREEAAHLSLEDSGVQGASLRESVSVEHRARNLVRIFARTPFAFSRSTVPVAENTCLWNDPTFGNGGHPLKRGII